MTDERLDLGLQFQRLIIKLATDDTEWVIRNREFLVPEYMELPQLQILVRGITEFYDKHDVAPTLEVLYDLVVEKHKGEFRQSLRQEFREIDTIRIQPSEAVHVTDRLRDFATRQKYRRTVLDMAEATEAGKFDEVRRHLDSAISYGEVASKGEVFYFNESAIDERSDVEADNEDRIATLFPTVDRHTRGGPSKRELWMFMAPPYRGKSMGLVNVAVNALFVKKNVLVVTVEMSAKKYAQRIDRRITNMTTNEIIERESEYRKKLTQFRSMYGGNLVIREYPSRSATVGDIAAYIKVLSRRHNFHTDVLVLDYVDELRRPKAELETYAIGAVVSELRGLASRMDVLVWSATQTTRGSLSKSRIDMDDVADSWEKAKISDGLIAQCQTDEEAEQERMRWYIVKNRDNKRYSKPIAITTRFETSTMKEI